MAASSRSRSSMFILKSPVISVCAPCGFGGAYASYSVSMRHLPLVLCHLAHDEFGLRVLAANLRDDAAAVCGA